MRKLQVLTLLLFSSVLTPAQDNINCTDWRVSDINQLYLPFFAGNPSVDGKLFDHAALLENTSADATKAANWKVISLGSDSLIPSVSGKDQLVLIAGYLESDRWTKASMEISTNALFELYLDGKKVKTQGTAPDKPVKVELTIGTGVHGLMLKLISTEQALKFSASLSPAGEAAEFTWSTNPARTVTIHDILEGESIADAKLSPSGKYLLIQTNEVLAESGSSQRSFRVYDTELNRSLFSLRNNTLRAQWMPETDRLSYQVEKGGSSNVYLFNISTGEETEVASGLKSPERITWSPKEDYFLFTRSVEAEKPGDLKRVFNNEDRIPGNRNRSYLYIFNLKTKLASPLTAGNVSAMLHDIKPDGSRILFSVSKTDYSTVPFSKQTLFELDPVTMQLDTIWKDKLHGGYCQYSPDGTQLLVSGGPETFGSLGVKMKKGLIPNSSATQLFCMILNQKKLKP
ncbi:MAG: hypothetical protein IPI69_13870 [Bacteroidales bacterium]|nr:hypothetical protein [Bacteroidales bacterium]